MRLTNETQMDIRSRSSGRVLMMALLFVAVFSAAAFFAQDSDQADAGGDSGDIHWEIADDTLTISLKEGKTSAQMPNYDKGKHPWPDAGYANLVISDGITYIGKFAFYDCDFKTFNIPGTVTSIGNGAFEECEYMVGHLQLNNVVSLGKYAFKNCKKLTELTIPISLDMVVDDDDNNEVFYHVEKLWKIHFLKGTGKGHDYSNDERDNTPTYYSRNSITEVVFDEGITHIGQGLLYKATKFTSLTIPSSVTSIGKGAFEECSGISGHLKLPAGLKSIDKYAFKKCTGITEITIPITVDHVVDGDDSNQVFCKDVNVRKITFLKGENGIGHNYAQNERDNTIAWESRKVLAEVIFEEGIVHIGDRTFYETAQLETLTIPDTVTSIGRGAFEGCTSITGHLKLPAGLNSVDKYAFKKCSNITELTIPISVDTVVDDDDDNEAFCDVEKIQKIHFLKGKGQGFSYDDDNRDNTPMHSSRKVLIEVTFEDGITSIGASTLYGAEKVRSISLPSSCVLIERCAFESTVSLQSAYLPGVKEIREYAFKNCNNLSYIQFSGALEKIDTKKDENFNKQAFYDSDGTTRKSVSVDDLRGYTYQGNNPSRMIREYTITFDGNGGTQPVSTMLTNMEGKLSKLDPATRDGYDFKGWFTQQEGGEQVTTGYFFRAHTTVYAHWDTVTPGSVKIIPGQVTVAIGEEYQLKYQTTPASAAGAEWKSSDTNVVTVDQNGKIRGVNNGDAVITVTVKGIKGTCNVHVNYQKGWKITFDGNGGIPAVEYLETDNEGRLRELPGAVREFHTFDGWFTEATGGTEITTQTKFTGDSTVYAQWTPVAVEAVTIDPESILLYIDNPVQLHYSVVPQGAYVYSVEWISNCEQITVDRDGNVLVTARPVAEEPLKITVRINGDDSLIQECKVAVYVPGVGATVKFNGNGGDPETQEIRKNIYGKLESEPIVPEQERMQFTGWYTAPEGGELVDITVPFGEVNLYAHWDEVPLKEIRFYYYHLFVPVDSQDMTLEYYVNPENATHYVVEEWVSSDEGIVTVVDGVLTFIAEGTANITAKIGDVVSQPCVVTVQKLKDIPVSLTVKDDTTFISNEDEVIAGLAQAIQSGQIPTVGITIDTDSIEMGKGLAKALRANKTQFELKNANGVIQVIDPDALGAFITDAEARLTITSIPINSEIEGRVLCKVDYSLSSDGEIVPQDFDTTVLIAFKYELDPQGIDGYRVCYYPDEGDPVLMEIDHSDGEYVYFKTTHFSTFGLVGPEVPPVPPSPPEDGKGGNLGLIIAVAVIAIVAILAIAYFVSRRKKQQGA